MADETRIEALLAGWQARWHDIFDAFPPTQDPLPRPALPLPIRDDDRLWLGFAWLPEAAQEACLALLPRGEALVAELRAVRGRWPMPEAEARRHLAEVLILTGRGSRLAGTARVLHQPVPPLLDRLTDAIEQTRFAGAEAELGEAGVAAMRLLGAVLVTSFDSDVAADCVTWPLSVSPGTPNPFRPLWAPEIGGWFVGEDGHRPVLCFRDDPALLERVPT